MATPMATNTSPTNSAAQITANLHSLFDNLSMVGSQAMQGQAQAMQGQNTPQLNQNQLSSLVNASLFGGMGMGSGVQLPPGIPQAQQAQLLVQMTQLQQQQNQAFQQLQQLQAQSGQQQLYNQTLSMLQANAQAQLAMQGMGMNPAMNNMMGLFNNPMTALGRGMGANPLLGSFTQGNMGGQPGMGLPLGRGMPRQNPELKPPPGGLQKKFDQS